MKKLLGLVFYLCCLLSLISCDPRPAKTTVMLQPFANFAARETEQVRAALLKIYRVDIVIAKSVNLPANAYYNPQKRYSADALISFLSDKKGNVTTIIGLTNQDIFTAKGSNKYWGVMGLGTLNADAGIVSIFRLHHGEVQLSELVKLTAHELGHNFGLPHCPDKTCIMADAEGHNSFYREIGLCEKCRQKLIAQGIIISAH